MQEHHATGWASPAPAWSAYTNDTRYGHGTLALVNATHARWRWHVNDAGEDEGAAPAWNVRDEAWIVQASDVCFLFFKCPSTGGGGITFTVRSR